MRATDFALNQADSRRLENLAREAGRTPRAMLKFVLRDGLAETERVIRFVAAGLADVAAGRVLPHAEVMAGLDAVLGRAGRAVNGRGVG